MFTSDDGKPDGKPDGEPNSKPDSRSTLLGSLNFYPADVDTFCPAVVAAGGQPLIEPRDEPVGYAGARH